MRIGPVAYTPGFSGEANDRGFRVSIAEASIILESQNYEQKTEIALESAKEWAIFWVIMVFYSILLILLLAPIVVNPSLAQRILLMTFSALILMFGGAIQFSVMIMHWISLPSLKRKNIKEYHGCEHKVIALLDGKMEPTLENLKKMPRLNIRCNTNIIPYLALLPLAIINTLIRPSITMFVIAVLGLIIVPLLIQFFLTTGEPSEEKLQEGLLVAKKLKEP